MAKKRATKEALLAAAIGLFQKHSIEKTIYVKKLMLRKLHFIITTNQRMNWFVIIFPLTAC